MRIAAYIGGLLGTLLLIALLIRADLGAIVHIAMLGGWMLLWLAPYRVLYFLSYATGWFYLLRPYDRSLRAGLGYLLWVTAVREGIDRLLPVASIGGGIVGVRLLRWRGLQAVSVSATVITEIILTLAVSYLFAALGFVLMIHLGALGSENQRILMGLLCMLPVPVATALLMRNGEVFGRMQSILSPLVGFATLSEGAAGLDRELRASLSRWRPLLLAGGLQFAALASASFEIWFALRLFGHPVSVQVALVLESATQAVRHLAFFVPAGLGVQEAGLILFGYAFGINAELALAVSMAKRIREVLCGLPPLISWQWLEARRLRRAPRVVC